MKNKKYEFLEHTADIKFRVWGKNLNEIFENAAYAISEVISRGRKISAKKKKKIKIQAKGNEALLYNFIDELLYLLDADGFLVSNVKVKLKENNLEADIFGDSAENYDNLDQIKAATYSEMYIKQKKDKTWEAQVVVDV